MWETESESEQRPYDGKCVSCGYVNPPGSSWCHRCGAGWLDRAEQPVVHARGGPAEPRDGLPQCGHVDPVEGCPWCRRGVQVHAKPANAPARRQDATSGRQRAGARVASEEWRRRRPASVVARALTGTAIIASIFAVGAVVLLTSGGTAERTSSGSRTPVKPITKHRSAAASALAERHTSTTRSLLALAPTRSASAPAERQTTTTRSLIASAPTTTGSQPAARQTTTAGSPATPAPTAALEAYWQSVKRHEFADAYAQLLPGALNLSEAQFVASEKEIKIQDASFSASVTSRTSTRATVVVRSLITRDQRYGCQTWSGSYELIETGGRWRIDRAAIAPQPCVD